MGNVRVRLSELECVCLAITQTPPVVPIPRDHFCKAGGGLKLNIKAHSQSRRCADPSCAKPHPATDRAGNRTAAACRPPPETRHISGSAHHHFSASLAVAVNSTWITFTMKYKCKTHNESIHFQRALMTSTTYNQSNSTLWIRYERLNHKFSH